MTLSEISKIRLINQQVVTSTMKSPKEVVSWMGAMQAQDYAMSKWAVGIRLPKVQEQDIEDAISKGEIIRTHVLRPTWHLVAAEDIHWMLALTGTQIKHLMKSRDKELELTDVIYAKSHKIIEKALANKNHLTREELVALLEEANIVTNDNRASHLLMRAELDLIIISGSIKNSKHTYALLSERVPNLTTFSKEEVLAKLAEKYFTSHGPATLQDFAWWSGLTQKDAKIGLESIKQEFTSIIIDSNTYWFKEISAQHLDNSVHLLPAFDEFIISYKDRTAVLSSLNHKKAVSNNGIFWPVIVVNGQVIGTWKRTIKKDKVYIETDFFNKPDTATLKNVGKSVHQYAQFLNKEAVI